MFIPSEYFKLNYNQSCSFRTELVLVSNSTDHVRQNKAICFKVRSK